MGDSPDARKQLIFEESRRALDEQQSVLDGLRTRTGVLIAAGSLSSTFLGGQALSKAQAVSCTSWAALVSFAIFGIASLAVLVPWPGWRFAHSGEKLKRNMETESDWRTIDGVHERLAEINDVNRRCNKAQLGWLFRAFVIACAALLFEVGFWLIELSNGG